MNPEHSLPVYAAVSRGKMLISNKVRRGIRHNITPSTGHFSRGYATETDGDRMFAEIELRGHPLLRLVTVEKLKGRGNYEVSLETHEPEHHERITVDYNKLVEELRRARYRVEHDARAGVVKIIKKRKEVGRVEYDPEHRGRAFIDSHSRNAETILRIALKHIDKVGSQLPGGPRLGLGQALE